MQRLSGLDAVFLYAETPTQPLHVTLCAILDPASMPGGYRFATVRDHIASRLHLVPPLNRRLVPVPLGLSHPVWTPATDLDIDQHVHRAAVPAPGGEAELAELVGTIASTPLDRSRPLWEMWIVEGLADDRIALVAKLHHAAIDGVAGVEQMVAFFDLEPVPATAAEAPAAEPSGPTESSGPTEPTPLELAAFGIGTRARSVAELGGLLGRTVRSTIAVRRRRAALDPLASDDIGGATPLVCPPTPVNGAIGARRTVAFARLGLDDVKAIKAPFGATVNDVVLAIAAGALRSLLLDRDALPAQPLVAACPISVRAQADGSATGNKLSTMFSHLRTDLADPVARFEATIRAAAASKDEHRLFDPDTLAGWAEQADPTLARLLIGTYSGRNLADRHPPAINLMVSNLPGPPFPLYLAGAELCHAYPMGPIMEGAGCNITMMSYRDSIDVGIIAAANLLPDPDQLARRIPAALAELAEAVAACPPGAT